MERKSVRKIRPRRVNRPVRRKERIHRPQKMSRQSLWKAAALTMRQQRLQTMCLEKSWNRSRRQMKAVGQTRSLPMKTARHPGRKKWRVRRRRYSRVMPVMVPRQRRPARRRRMPEIRTAEKQAVT